MCPCHYCSGGAAKSMSHTHTQTDTHTHKQTQTDKHTHIHTHTCTRTYTYTHTHKHAHLHTHAHTHTCTNARARTRTHARTHTHTHTKSSEVTYRYGFKKRLATHWSSLPSMFDPQCSQWHSVRHARHQMRCWGILTIRQKSEPDKPIIPVGLLLLFGTKYASLISYSQR